jgi:hypothetical protein
MDKPNAVSGFTSGVLGAGALAVGIIGLAGLAPWVLAGVGVIIVGLLFMSVGAQSSRSTRQILAEAGVSDGTGLSAHSAAGGGGVVLGILTLLGVVPAILTGAAIIAFGAAFILSASSQARTAQAAIEQGGEGRMVIAQALSDVTSGLLLIGAADLVLGILAVSKYADPSISVSLVLVAILTTGALSFLATAGGGRMLGMLGL